MRTATAALTLAALALSAPAALAAYESLCGVGSVTRGVCAGERLRPPPVAVWIRRAGSAATCLSPSPRRRRSASRAADSRTSSCAPGAATAPSTRAFPRPARALAAEGRRCRLHRSPTSALSSRTRTQERGVLHQGRPRRRHGSGRVPLPVRDAGRHEPGAPDHCGPLVRGRIHRDAGACGQPEGFPPRFKSSPASPCRRSPVAT